MEPAKKNYGGAHVGNQRAQSANVVRKHILNGGVAEGERTRGYVDRWPTSLDGIIQQKQRGARAAQAGFEGAFMASTFRPQKSVRNPYNIRDDQQRMDRAKELAAKLGVDKVKLAIPSVIDTTPQAGHHTAAAPAESSRQSHRPASHRPASSMRDGSWPTTMDYYESAATQRRATGSSAPGLGRR